ncbi:MAG: hypothetical protein NC432_08120 [Roseburia sp.]|nr:hypothetical protein [Roseburia sp.]MCM1099093.1 hypothetical protein [Ruminococcus flavefaciens]
MRQVESLDSMGLMVDSEPRQVNRRGGGVKERARAALLSRREIARIQKNLFKFQKKKKPHTDGQKVRNINMKRDDLVIFSTARVVYDSYKAKFDAAKAKKEQRFKDLNANFRPGSPMFIIERDKITPEFQEEVETAREEARRHFMDELENARIKERAYAAVVSGSVKDMLNTLKCLEDLPISVDEYNVLASVHGDKFYFVDRFLEKLARKNGIQNSSVQPPLTTKLEILDKLEAEVTEYLNKYDGENKNFLITSSDNHIFRLEDSYTNGYKNINMDNAEKAKRMISQALNKGDSMERSLTLANMIRTSAPELQTDILTELTERDHTALSDPTMNLTGVTAIIENFKKSEYDGIKKAKETVQKIKSEKMKHVQETIVYRNLEDRHFLREVQQSNDDSLKRLVKEAQEIKEYADEKERREAATQNRS